jgi:hypothetical protein
MLRPTPLKFLSDTLDVKNCSQGSKLVIGRVMLVPKRAESGLNWVSDGKH